tara:strand:+ start:633 stop:1034 length:402 start_codon:yes stop_codon:yes gene_type:complete
MKKILLVVFTSIVLLSCSDNDVIDFEYTFVPIDEVTAPVSFTFGETDTLKLKYTLPNSCYHFNDVYYQYRDSTRIVAISAIKELDTYCTESLITAEFNLLVTARQEEDYLFKFWIGKDSDGENIFEEVIVPVN